MKPLGLLYIAAILKQQAHDVAMIDCMDRHHPALAGAWPGLPARKQRQVYGCGHYIAQEVPKPPVLAAVPRRYWRFGMPAAIFARELSRQPCPDVVMVTSGMTYWYPGVQECIRTIKDMFPAVPVMLGGTYATLCTEHAQNHTKADMVVAEGPGYEQCGRRGGEPWRSFLYGLGHAMADFSTVPPPDYSFYRHPAYGVLRATRGCPLRCRYCASAALTPGGYQRKPPATVAGEIISLWRQGISDIAWYDDALLIDAPVYFMSLMELSMGAGVGARFHSPNGLHAREISPAVARLMRQSGFVMPRIALETADPGRQLSSGGKVTNEIFASAVRHLRSAGYRPGEYAAYILIGMAGQAPDEIEHTIRYAHEQGAKILMADYSPIPGTPEGDAVHALLPSRDPLWHNKSLFALHTPVGRQRLQQLKDLAHRLNQELRQ